MGSITALKFFGGATNITINADTALNTNYRFWRVTNTGATTVEVTFPPTATIGLLVGGPIFVLANVGSVAFNYRDFEDTLPLLSLAAGKAMIVSTYAIGCMLNWAPHATAFNYSSY